VESARGYDEEERRMLAVGKSQANNSISHKKAQEAQKGNTSILLILCLFCGKYAIPL